MNHFTGTRCIAALIGCSCFFASTQLLANGSIDPMLSDDLHHVARLRIFFGHQSVGANLLDGVAQLATKAGVPLKIQESNTAKGVGLGVMGHVRIGKNGNPTGKLDEFNKALGQGPTGLNIAVLKFCYVDFTPTTDVKSLFASYRSTVESIKARNPGLTIVHVTTPLTTVQSGPKALIKTFFGKAPYGVLENLRRDEYNSFIRETYQGREPIFDLAKIESTAPDGASINVAWKGLSIPALSPAYTDDGSHLNTNGQLVAARNFLSILASATER